MNATERIDQLKKERRNELRSQKLAAEAAAAEANKAARKKIEDLLPEEEKWMMAFFQHTKYIEEYTYARFCVPTHADLLLQLCRSWEDHYTNGGWHWHHCDGPEYCTCLADALIAAEYTV
jgi:hypothetical protein